MVFRCQVIIGILSCCTSYRAHLDVPWRIGEKEKAMEIDRLHEDDRGVVFELDSFDQRYRYISGVAT